VACIDAKGFTFFVGDHLEAFVMVQGLEVGPNLDGRIGELLVGGRGPGAQRTL
jgi:hypothetical protein